MIELDRFKYVNHTFGHAAGDTILPVDTVLQDIVRKTDTVARIGGNELVVLMTELDNKAGQDHADSLTTRLNLENVSWTTGDL